MSDPAGENQIFHLTSTSVEMIVSTTKNIQIRETERTGDYAATRCDVLLCQAMMEEAMDVVTFPKAEGFTNQTAKSPKEHGSC